MPHVDFAYIDDRGLSLSMSPGGDIVYLQKKEIGSKENHPQSITVDSSSPICCFPPPNLPVTLPYPHSQLLSFDLSSKKPSPSQTYLFGHCNIVMFEATPEGLYILVERKEPSTTTATAPTAQSAPKTSFYLQKLPPASFSPFRSPPRAFPSPLSLAPSDSMALSAYSPLLIVNSLLREESRCINTLRLFNRESMEEYRGREIQVEGRGWEGSIKKMVIVRRGEGRNYGGFERGWKDCEEGFEKGCEEMLVLLMDGERGVCVYDIEWVEEGKDGGETKKKEVKQRVEVIDRSFEPIDLFPDTYDVEFTMLEDEGIFVPIKKDTKAENQVKSKPTKRYPHLTLRSRIPNLHPRRIHLIRTCL